MRSTLARPDIPSVPPVIAAMVARATSLATVTATTLLIVLAVTPTPDTSAALVGLTVLLLAGVIAARSAAVALGACRPSSGIRAQAHRHSLDRMPAPLHPRTAGRPSPRAPAGVVATA